MSACGRIGDWQRRRVDRTAKRAALGWQPLTMRQVPSAIRRALPIDAHDVAELWLRSRRAAVPSIPPSVHDDDEVRRWFEVVVVPSGNTWVIDGDAGPVALLVLDREEIDQLYVDPPNTGCGLGSALVEFAKAAQPEGLFLWTFQTNVGARRFYERLGFIAVAETDGDNEEGAPDVRYHWPG